MGITPERDGAAIRLGGPSGAGFHRRAETSQLTDTDKPHITFWSRGGAGREGRKRAVLNNLERLALRR
jgi:hypothetical protein